MDAPDDAIFATDGRLSVGSNKTRQRGKTWPCGQSWSLTRAELLLLLTRPPPPSIDAAGEKEGTVMLPNDNGATYAASAVTAAATVEDVVALKEGPG